MNAGDVYGPYRIVRRIGRGNMGDVFLAEDVQTHRQLALKLVYNGPEAEDREIVAAERVGAELQKRVAAIDRRVVRVNSYGEIAGDLFIDMEYVDGEDLSTLIAHGPLNTGFAVHVARELCEMLDHLGAFTTTIGDREFAGVIHGDLKPRNVRIDRQNQVKVLDFGIAKALTHTRKYTMNVFASSAYCSPERLETQNMDADSDLWSVGVLLYQMAAHRLPFDEPTKERLERRIRSAQPPDPLPASCPEPLRRIIFKMLARNPVERYRNAQEVVEDLVRFQNGRPVIAAPVHPTVPVDNEATVRTSQSVQTPAPGDRTIRTRTSAALILKRRPTRRLLGCVAVLGAGSVALVAFASQEMNFWGDAGKLKDDLQSERLANLDQGWTRYEALNKRMHFGVFLWGAERALRKRLIGAADEIISEYRNSDAPSVYEPQWIAARNDLSRALALAPDDNGIKGRLRVCEGHIDRIEANKMRGSPRQKESNTAADKFNEAADLLKHSPDPYIGLASVYIYNLNDVDKGEEALQKAARYGHPLGKRESAQLADGYRRRADQMWRQSRSVTGSPDEERDYLNKAKKDYMHAEDLYERAGVFGDAIRNRQLAIQGEQRVDGRLADLQMSGGAQ